MAGGGEAEASAGGAPGAMTEAKRPVIIGGAVALLVGIGLLLWGITPAKGFAAAGDAFSGSAADAEGITSSIDAAMAGLVARSWATGLGFVLLLGGIIAVKTGQPREKSVQQQVEEQVQHALASTGLAASMAPMAPAPTSPPATASEETAASPGTEEAPLEPPTERYAAAMPRKGAEGGSPRPSQAAPPGRRCPSCGSLLVAGGRICPSCGPAQG